MQMESCLLFASLSVLFLMRHQINSKDVFVQMTYVMTVCDVSHGTRTVYALTEEIE